jgi:hypothetical protein
LPRVVVLQAGAGSEALKVWRAFALGIEMLVHCDVHAHVADDVLLVRAVKHEAEVMNNVCDG